MNPEPSESARKFEMEIEIDAPTESVWKAISDERELCRWFAPEATIESSVGGGIVWRWDSHFTWKQRIEILEPGARLLTRYDSAVAAGDGGKKPLFIDFSLEGHGGTTTLRLTQYGFGADAAFDKEYDGISSGWPVELQSLKLYLERHRGKDRQLAWSRASVDVSAVEAWKRLTSSDGFQFAVDRASLGQGDAFSLQTGDGDVFAGTVIRSSPTGFNALVTNKGDAYLRFWVENYQGATQVWLWLASYGQADGQSAQLQARWNRMLGRMFPARCEAEAVSSEGA